MDAGAVTLTAALLAGFAGSGHCLAMCGGLAGALGMRARAASHDTTGVLARAMLYHAGRLGGYAVAGALCGALGATLHAALDLARISIGLRLASGVLLILVAMRVLFAWNALAGLERLGARLWRTIQPLAGRAALGGGVGDAALLGFLWGWLPCGLVYSMLVFAALSGDAANGAAVMLAFGVGTLPSMLTSSVLVTQVQRLVHDRSARLVSGVLLLAFGVWLAAAALHPVLTHSHSHGHHVTDSPPSHAH
ncbi:MAG TPA: sulfite exporter TauE/SafE family protein [Steroidobacter sp.]|nr:sulfite exporter TauE/SafE family protein [Steroidobacter sp.]